MKLDEYTQQQVTMVKPCKESLQEMLVEKKTLTTFLHLRGKVDITKLILISMVNYSM